MNLATAFLQSAQKCAGKPAIFWGEEVVTYDDIVAQSRWLASKLSDEMLVKPGERVAIWLKNCPEFVSVLFGILQSGAVVVPINNFLKPKGTDAVAKGQGYIQGWYTAALMMEGVKNALADGGELTGEKIKAGLEKIKDFKTAASDPVSFSSTFHGGLLSSPIYQVEGGVFKKIQDPIKIER